ncbi:MmgE/PrpD family protein [Chloroflexota bacterium]
MGTTEKVANFIVEFDFNDIPEKGIDQAKSSILDTIGTALVGSAGPVGTILANFVTEMGGNPQARLIGKGIRTSILDAALANGAFAHVDDYDDMGSIGHAGAVFTPPALALGEHLQLSGKKLLEAYAVGFEIGYKLRTSMGEVQNEGGFHSTALFGTVGAAAESAKLLGLDIAKTRVALGIAASLAFGIMQNFGTYTKPLHAGNAARNGILAAILAKKGLTADPDILEGPRGFFCVFGQQQSVISQMTQNIGKPLAISEYGVRIKPWPCCGGNNEALTAILHLIEQHDIKPDEVNNINVATSWKPPGSTIRINPRNGFEGHFSLQYNMALALLDRKIDLDSYSDEKFSRPAMQDLIKKVNVIWHPDCVDRPLRLQSESRFAIVTLNLKDGRVISEQIDTENRKHLVGEEIYDKYTANAKIGGVPENNIERSIELIKRLEELKDIKELMDIVAKGIANH